MDEFIRHDNFAVLRGEKGPVFPKLMPMVTSEIPNARGETSLP